MNIISVMWMVLCVLFLFICMLVLLVGGLYVLNVEITEITGINLAKECVERKWKNYTH